MHKEDGEIQKFPSLGHFINEVEFLRGCNLSPLHLACCAVLSPVASVLLLLPFFLPVRCCSILACHLLHMWGQDAPPVHHSDLHDHPTLYIPPALFPAVTVAATLRGLFCMVSVEKIAISSALFLVTAFFRFGFLGRFSPHQSRFCVSVVHSSEYLSPSMRISGYPFPTLYLLISMISFASSFCSNAIRWLIVPSVFTHTALTEAMMCPSAFLFTPCGGSCG